MFRNFVFEILLKYYFKILRLERFAIFNANLLKGTSFLVVQRRIWAFGKTYFIKSVVM